MPKIVDWDARRDEILSATWRVIARDGIAKATIRAIAREANCSRGILAHYFDDKADILGSALVCPIAGWRPGWTPGPPGWPAWMRCGWSCSRRSPWTRERDLEAQIEISFWSRALGNPALGCSTPSSTASPSGCARPGRGRDAGRAAPRRGPRP